MSFKVHVHPSGHTFQVEDGETVVDAAVRSGVALPYGCRGGFCGACKGKVLAGEYRYEDEPGGLEEGDAEAGLALFCQAHPTSDMTIQVDEVASEEQIPVRSFPAKVARMERLNDDVMALYLKLPEGERLQFLAGQYMDFLVEENKRRAFSIANAPHDDEYLQFHIRRIKGGRFTEKLFEQMHEKDIVRVEGPHGNFYLREDSNRAIILLATGTGFGPVKGIIEHALAEKSERPIYLYWGARTHDGLYQDALARGWAEAHDNVHYIPVLSRPEPDWTGRTGYVQDAVMADFDDLSGFEVYACGHPQMVLAARDMLTAKGLEREHCFSDAFEWAKD